MARLGPLLALTPLLGISGARAEDPTKDLVRVPATPAPAPKLSPAARWAILIGVDEYEDRTIADLRFSANDAHTLADLLVASGAYPADHVLLLTPDQEDPQLRPTRANILRTLAWARSLKGADTLLFFFSGHGGSTEASGASTNVLYPSDAVFKMPGDTGISLDRVFEVLEQAEARRRVVIVDACRNRFAEAKAAAAPSWEDPRYRLSQGTMVLYGTEPGGYSYEDDEAKRGALTRALVEGLQGEADGQLDPADGMVGMNELFAFAVERLQSRGRKSGRVQVPYRGGEWTGADLALVPEWVADAYDGSAFKRFAAEEQPLADPPGVVWQGVKTSGAPTRVYKTGVTTVDADEPNERKVPAPHLRYEGDPMAGAKAIGFRCVRRPERAIPTPSPD